MSKPGADAAFDVSLEAMFQMFGVFSEFEHTIIRERVKAGTDRARARQVVWSTAYLSSHRGENQIDAQAGRRHGQDRPSTRLWHGDGPANQAPANEIKSSMTAVWFARPVSPLQSRRGKKRQDRCFRHPPGARPAREHGASPSSFL